MSKTYRPWNPNQQWLLPPSVHDWLPENDLVYFILDTVNELDISAITQKYEQEERGFPPYNPRMMVALLFYAYCRGIFSSRKIMQACEERLTFRVIAGDDIMPRLRKHLVVGCQSILLLKRRWPESSGPKRAEKLIRNGSRLLSRYLARPKEPEDLFSFRCEALKRCEVSGRWYA
jgi:hypothetical protein